MRRRISNGASTLIYKHPWLVNEQNPFVETAPLVDFENTVVAYLLILDGREWNNELIDEVFEERDASLIKQVPLSIIAHED